MTDDWTQTQTILMCLDQQIDWALDVGAARVFRQATGYRQTLLEKVSRLAQEELAMFEFC